MSFNSQAIYCPHCPTSVIAGHDVGEELRLIEENYHGLDIDIAECPECKNVYQISYKVDEIVRLPCRDEVKKCRQDQEPDTRGKDKK